jgi:hypothetical protein
MKNNSNVLPKEGGFIMIRQLIPVEIPIDPLSIYFAKPFPKIVTKDIHEFDSYEYNKKLEIRAIIHTPWGDVTILPHEYSVIGPDKLSEYFEAVKIGHAFIKHYGKDDKKNISSQRLADAIFYLRSRGITYGDALGMCLGLIDKYDILFIEMHEEYQRMFTRHYDQYIAGKTKFLADRAAGIPYFSDTNVPGMGEAIKNKSKPIISKKKQRAIMVQEQETKLQKELAEYLGVNPNQEEIIDAV